MCLLSAWDKYMIFKTVGLHEITKEMRVCRGKRRAKILGYSSIKKIGDRRRILQRILKRSDE